MKIRSTGIDTKRGSRTFTRYIGVSVAAVLLLVAPSTFAAGQAENSEAERAQIDEIVGEYAQENIDDEQEREEFEREVVEQLSERLVDVQGLEIALRAFDPDSDDFDGQAHADEVLAIVERTEEKVRRGESPHKAAASSRFEARERIPEHVSAGEENRERARDLRREAQKRANRGRDGVPGDPAGDAPDSGRPDRR